LAEHEGCPAARVRAIPNGIDMAKFHPRWPSRALQEELGLAPGAPVVGIVAALRPEKNHELFLRAGAMVRRQRPDVRLLIVGDGPERAKLEALATDLGLCCGAGVSPAHAAGTAAPQGADAARFLGTRSDVPELLALMDVLVLASHMEANPVSIMEAMAGEKPVVATRVGSVPDTVLDGATGYLTAPGDARQLADRVLQLLADPQQAAALGRAGRERVIACCSVERMVQGYEDLLAGLYAAKCLSRRGRPRQAAQASPGREPRDTRSR